MTLPWEAGFGVGGRSDGGFASPGVLMPLVDGACRCEGRDACGPSLEALEDNKCRHEPRVGEAVADDRWDETGQRAPAPAEDCQVG